MSDQAERDSQGRTCEEELTWAIETQPQDYTPETPGMMAIFVCYQRAQLLESDSCSMQASSCFAMSACSDAFDEMMQMAGTGGTPDSEGMDPMLMSLMMNRSMMEYRKLSKKRVG